MSSLDLIKANFPARISFRVASKVDSRTILDSNGAEQLLGRGDMLFLPPGSSRLMRVHGPLVTEEEVAAVVEFLKQQGKPAYNERILESPEERTEFGESDGQVDELYDDAVKIVMDMGKASRRSCNAGCVSAMAAPPVCWTPWNAMASSARPMEPNHAQS